MKRKNKRRKRTKKLRRKKNIRRKFKKKIPKISFKKFKNLKISKQIKQLEDLSSQLTSKRKKIIKNQINLLRKISLDRLEGFASQSINKAYENIKKKQEIKRLKQIKLEEREKA